MWKAFDSLDFPVTKLIDQSVRRRGKITIYIFLRVWADKALTVIRDEK